MKRRLILLVTTFLSLSTLGGCGFAGIDSWEKPVKIEDIKAQVLTQDSYDPTSMYVEITSFKNIQGFSYELFKLQLNETNPIISPISAYLALTLTGCGARGETLEEFKQQFERQARSFPWGYTLQELKLIEQDPNSNSRLRMNLEQARNVIKNYVINTLGAGASQELQESLSEVWEQKIGSNFTNLSFFLIRPFSLPLSFGI